MSIKKSLFIGGMIPLFLSACSNHIHHRGIDSSNITTPKIEARPMEASVEIGQKMRGRAQCKSFMGIFYGDPEKEAYGATLETRSGNVAPDQCTRAAIYNALSRTNAEVIVAPQYEVTSNNFMCVPVIDACLHRSVQVEVIGYEGKYKNISEMDENVIKARQIATELEKENVGLFTKNGLFAIFPESF